MGEEETPRIKRANSIISSEVKFYPAEEEEGGDFFTLRGLFFRRLEAKRKKKAVIPRYAGFLSVYQHKSGATIVLISHPAT